MRNTVMPALFLILISGLPGCKNDDERRIEEKPAVDTAPRREQLQQANWLEKKMQNEAEEQRKVIEIQSR